MLQKLRNQISWVSVVILLFLAACSPLTKYKTDPSVLGWEKDIREFEKRDSVEKHSPEAVLFTGSSSIRLWSTISEDMAPYEVIHRGYGGAKFSDFAYYAKRIIYPHQFRAMVFFVSNDITGTPKDKTPDEVVSLCMYVVKTVRQKYPSTPVFWIEITPTPSRWKVWDSIKEVNQKIKEVSKRSANFYVIETSSSFLDASGQPKKGLFREDQLHLNKEGYAIWTDIIKKALDARLK